MTIQSTVLDGDLMGPAPYELILQFFAYEHLPAHLQAVSRPFGELAATIVATLPRNTERTVALRKLLEAKDCAVRALLFKPTDLLNWPLCTCGANAVTAGLFGPPEHAPHCATRTVTVQGPMVIQQLSPYDRRF